MRVFSAEDLRHGDGKDGRPVWFAYKGKVYEVNPESKLWKNGRHVNRHPAGTDLTLDMGAAPHTADVLSRATLIGELREEKKAEIETAQGIVAQILAQHPHPISVHFPIALSFAAAIFSFINLVWGFREIELAGFCNQVLAGLVMPFTVFTGYLSWRYNYQRKKTFEFNGKILLSILLPFSMYGAIAFYAIQYFGSGEIGGPLHWFYHVLVFVTAANVLALGYLGGRITFPR